MYLKTILAASVFALSAAALSASAHARVGGGGYAEQAQPDAPVPPESRGRRGGWGQNAPAVPAYQPPPQQPAAPPQYDGRRGQHPPGAGHPPGHPGAGWDRNRDRHRDRDRRRERFRDGAAVVLGLGAIGALAHRPRQDPYYGYGYPPPPPPPPPSYPAYPAYPAHPGYEQPYPYDPQAPYSGGYGAGVIRCSSGDYRTTWCAIPPGTRATIRRRLSKSSCNYGTDWGVAPNAIWVANGCRAEFTLY